MTKSSSIVKQASILAVAGIVVRIIGLLYRSPLTHMISDIGNAYYATAYNIYALVLLVSSYSIPTAISKLVSEKISLKQYKNVRKIIKCVFIYVCVIAGGAAIVLFFIAPYIVDENAVPALRVLCPTILLSGLLGVYRGYFQAHKTTVFTSISQIIEQVFHAVVALLAAYLFIQPYIGDKVLTGRHGAAGAALGTGAGVLVGLIYMVIMYMNKKYTFEEETNEGDDEEATYKEIFKLIIQVITPIIIATCVYNLVSTIDMYLFNFTQSLRGVEKIAYMSSYGVYTGKYLPLQNVPVALASAMSAAAIPAISSSWALKNYKETKEHISSGLTVTMLILIPAAVGMAVLSYPIMSVLFPQKETIQMASLLLAFGSPAIVFYGISTLTNGILQGLGLINIPLKNAIFALVCHIAGLSALLLFTPIGVYGLMIGNCTYALQVCVMNQLALKKHVGYKQAMKKIYLIPVICSIIMAIVVAGVYYMLFKLTHMVVIPMGVSIVVGIVVYFAGVIFFYYDQPETLYAIPYMRTIMSKIKKFS